MLYDRNNVCHILDSTSQKSKRVVRSIMGGGVYAFMDAFDIAYVLKKDLDMMFDTKLDIIMFTDSKKLFDAVTCGKRTTERRLSIDVTAARQSYKQFEITSIGLMRGDVNPADGLTKPDGNGALKTIVESGRDLTPVEQWIERECVDEQSTGLDEGVAV